MCDVDRVVRYRRDGFLMVSLGDLQLRNVGAETVKQFCKWEYNEAHTFRMRLSRQLRGLLYPEAIFLVKYSLYTSSCCIHGCATMTSSPCSTKMNVASSALP